jgi:hypothetical protein
MNITPMQNLINAVTAATEHAKTGPALWAAVYAGSVVANETANCKDIAAALPNQVTGKAHSQSTIAAYVIADLITSEVSWVEVFADLGITKLPHNIVTSCQTNKMQTKTIKAAFKAVTDTDPAKRKAQLTKVIRSLNGTKKAPKSAAEKAADEKAATEKVAKAEKVAAEKAAADDVRNSKPAKKAEGVVAVIQSMVKDLDNEVANADKAAAAVMGQIQFLSAAIDRNNVRIASAKAKAAKVA